MSYNKMQYVTSSGKVRVRTMPNGNEKSMLHTVLKDAVNIYTPMVKGLLHPQLVTERPVGVREKVLAFRKNQKAGFINEANKNQGVIVKKDIGTGGWILEMTGKIYLESQVMGRADMEGKNSHHLYDGIRLGKPKEPICMSAYEQETVGMYVRRSCRPTCELRHLFATELHLIVVARKPLKKGEEVTLAFELDCLGFNSQSKCASHERNPEDCPLEKNLLLRKAQKENPAAYSTVVTITDSDEEIETIVRRQPQSVESSGPSSSNASSRPSPNLPENPPVLQNFEIPGPSNRENVNNLLVAPQVPLPSPNPVDPAVIVVQDPLLLRDPIATSPPAPCLIFRLPSFSSSPSGSENADPETAPDPMDAPEAVDPSAAPDLPEPEEAAAPVDVAAVPATAIAPSTRTRRRSMRLGQSAVPATSVPPTRAHYRAGLQNADPNPAPELMDAPEVAAQEQEEVAAPANIPATVTAPQTRRRLRSAANGQPAMRHGQPAAPDFTEPEQVGAPGAAAPLDVATPVTRTSTRSQSAAHGRPALRTRQSTALSRSKPDQVAVPVDVAPALQTRTRHRISKKPTGASSRVLRVQNAQSGNSAAVTSPRTDRHTRSSARSVADGRPTIHDAPIAPPAGRKNKNAQKKAQAANARRGLREKFEAQRLAAANVDPAPAALAAPTTPGAPTAPVVVNAPTTRSSQTPDSTRRRAASRSAPRSGPRLAPAPPPTSRPAVPRRSGPGPSAPLAPRTREVSIARQNAIALIGQSMHPTRAAVKQLREKAPSAAQGGQASTSDAPATKKPRKTPGQQQPKGRGGKK